MGHRGKRDEMKRGSRGGGGRGGGRRDDREDETGETEKINTARELKQRWRRYETKQKEG